MSWILETGNWILETGNWLLVIGNWVVGFWCWNFGSFLESGIWNLEFGTFLESGIWNMEFGTFLESGIWNLEFGTFLEFGIWNLEFLLWCLLLALLYLLTIGFFTLGWYMRSGSPVGGRRSAVSVVVAAKNEEKHIADLLNDLSIQDYPLDLTEFIIVDDHSGDGTSAIIKEFIGRNIALNIKVLKTADFNVSGKKAAINLGIEHAAGEIIITTDADCRVGPGWISALADQFRDERIMMVFGPVSYLEGKGFWDDFQSEEFAGLVASGAGAALAGHPFMCNGANLAYRKEAFSRVRGFEGNEHYLSGDDVFLLHKVKKEFGKTSIIFCKDQKSIVKTYPAEGLVKFLGQRIRWASKSRGYKDALSIATAIIIFSYSLTVLSSFIAGFFNPFFFLAFGGLIFLKMIADFPLMMGITSFTGQQRLMRWYVPFQVVYPVYIVVAGMLSFFGRQKW